MKIISIEPTPSPNTMKLNMDEKLPDGVKMTYTSEHKGSSPDYIEKLLAIPNVKSVFHVANFIAIERISKGDWQSILSQAREAFGQSADDIAAPAGASATSAAAADESYGEAMVLVQKFRGIPLQVRVRSGTEEVRAALPERFSKAAFKAQSSSPNLIMERKLEEQGARYGELQDILQQVVQELDATYDDERLEQLVAQAFGEQIETDAEHERIESEHLAVLDDPDWKKRYAALEKMKPTAETMPFLIKALDDSNSSIRRLATVYLGDIKEPEVFPYLYKALEDKSVSVRRTAGDCLSDIGDPDAIPAMIKALKDPNKLVRWRAARYLYEVGDESCLSALREAQDDPEFEVSMQIKIALARIEGGEAAEGSVWQQMTRRNEK